ncbi:MAG: PepSY domain-containing protein [Bacteroidota bacterium]
MKKRNGKLLQRLRKWHKWPSLIFTLFILLFACSGIILNHRSLRVIHSGEIYGTIGKLIVDAIGIIFIILCITGLIYFFAPHRLNRLNNETRKIRLERFSRNSLRWHNSVGSWTI